MSLRDFLANVSVILTVMAAAALIETAVPMFMAKPWKHPRRTANLGLTALSFLSNWLLASVAALAAVWLRPAGVFAGLAWPAICRIGPCTCGPPCGGSTRSITATTSSM